MIKIANRKTVNCIKGAIGRIEHRHWSGAGKHVTRPKDIDNSERFKILDQAVEHILAVEDVKSPAMVNDIRHIVNRIGIAIRVGRPFKSVYIRGSLDIYDGGGYPFCIQRYTDSVSGG